MSEAKKDLVLDVRNLTVHYVLEEECVEAVNDVSIQLEKGKILAVFQKGYRVKDRIVRHSMVKVSE